jgi:hypothetical protein
MMMTAIMVIGMRRDCDLLIHLDVGRALAAGYKFWISSNRVLLSEGNAGGFIPSQFFARAERLAGGRVVEVLSLDPTPSPTVVLSVAAGSPSTVPAKSNRRPPPGFGDEEKPQKFSSSPSLTPTPTPTPTTVVTDAPLASAVMTGTATNGHSSAPKVELKQNNKNKTNNAAVAKKSSVSRSAAVIDDDDTSSTTPAPSTARAPSAAPAALVSTKPAKVAAATTSVTPTAPFLPPTLPATFTDRKWPVFVDKGDNEYAALMHYCSPSHSFML